MQHKKITNTLLILSLAVFLFGGGYKLGQYQTAQSKIERPTYNILNSAPVSAQAVKDTKNIDFSLFWDAWDQLEQKYVDHSKIDPQKMFYGAIKGMVASVNDPYTFFLTPTENQQTKDDLGGRFEGIGAQLGMENNMIVVVAPLKNSPAEAAGVRAGDLVVKVNGEPTKGWLLTQAVAKIRGEKGTKVKLTLQRDGKDMDVEMVRNTINVDSVEVKVDEKQTDCGTICGNVAYLKLSQFGENTVDEWDAQIPAIKQAWDQKKIKGMVLDLRDNPGGYLESAVYLAGEFLPKGDLVVRQESKVFGNKDYNVARTGQLLDIPLVVLINRGSASAAEILSGALRDHKRATLIGEKSFGKGSVQEAFDLTAGAGMHVTVAKWVLPSGKWINGVGIQPDIPVELKVPDGNTLTRPMDTQLDRAIQEVTK